MQVQTEKRSPMNEHPFTAFIDLISLDQEIRTAHETIATLKKERDEFLEQKQELIDRLDQFKQHVNELKKKVHEHELAMKELDSKEKKKKSLMEQPQNIKLYQPLKKEIDQLKQAQHEAESVLMGIWNKLEVSQKELEEQQTSYNSKIEELHTQISEKQDQIESLKKGVEEKSIERPAKEVGVPAEWLDKYTHMRMRVPDPVVPVMRESCSACFYTITNQEMIKLKRRALVQCKNCFRLLFLQEAMDEVANKESSNEKETDQ